jgi:hypothetical protein
MKAMKSATGKRHSLFRISVRTSVLLSLKEKEKMLEKKRAPSG